MRVRRGWMTQVRIRAPTRTSHGGWFLPIMITGAGLLRLTGMISMLTARPASAWFAVAVLRRLVPGPRLRSVLLAPRTSFQPPSPRRPVATPHESSTTSEARGASASQQTERNVFVT